MSEAKKPNLPIGFWLKKVDQLLTDQINQIQAQNGWLAKSRFRKKRPSKITPHFLAKASLKTANFAHLTPQMCKPNASNKNCFSNEHVYTVSVKVYNSFYDYFFWR